MQQVVMETEIPHCIVAQIRKKYSTITNTYKKQCPCQLKNIASLELVEELQCSSSRSRKEMGKRVHLPYNRLFKGPNGRKKNSKRILIMGEPGVGKTILCASIAEDWAKGKFFQEFLVVVFLPLNQRYIASAQNLQELLKSVYEFDSETCSTAIMHLRANEKDNVLIIADGWDDLRESESQQGSFLHNLLFGNLLPSSSLTVVVTSRSATNPCHFIDQFIAVQGFSENTTKSYIQNELSSNPEKLKHVTEQIDTSALVETMCSVPLNLALICNFYQSCDDDLPSTMPEIYGKIAWNLAHMKINGTKKYGRILKLSNYQDLPEELRQTWLHFCQLAFQTVEKCHATVSQEDISSFVTFKLEAFGLLKPIVSSGGDEVTFSFLHPAFRYYLASLHLTMQPQSVQLKAIETMGHALAPCFGDFF